MSGAFKCFLKRKEKCVVLYTDDYEIYCGVVKKDYTEEQARELMQKQIDKLNFEEDRKGSEKYKILSWDKDVMFRSFKPFDNEEYDIVTLRKHATIVKGKTEPMWIFGIGE
ncbi:hypothetical protein [Fusobacterium varium]|uniref:hypothetical protein n=1 Tax=Fusobacterium varium TaxID=856 RepID=UPI0035696367